MVTTSISQFSLFTRLGCSDISTRRWGGGLSRYSRRYGGIIQSYFTNYTVSALKSTKQTLVTDQSASISRTRKGPNWYSGRRSVAFAWISLERVTNHSLGDYPQGWRFGHAHVEWIQVVDWRFSFSAERLLWFWLDGRNLSCGNGSNQRLRANRRPLRTCQISSW